MAQGSARQSAPLRRLSEPAVAVWGNIALSDLAERSTPTRRRERSLRTPAVLFRSAERAHRGATIHAAFCLRATSAAGARPIRRDLPRVRHQSRTATDL